MEGLLSTGPSLSYLTDPVYMALEISEATSKLSKATKRIYRKFASQETNSSRNGLKTLFWHYFDFKPI